MYALQLQAFRTDAEISRSGPAKRERELQAWKPDGPDAVGGQGSAGTFELARGDDATFGPGASAGGGSWDQFAANERLFGVRTHFDEDEYTTRLDRTAKDFKERERRAEQLAAEITGVWVSSLFSELAYLMRSDRPRRRQRTIHMYLKSAGLPSMTAG